MATHRIKIDLFLTDEQIAVVKQYDEQWELRGDGSKASWRDVLAAIAANAVNQRLEKIAEELKASAKSWLKASETP